MRDTALTKAKLRSSMPNGFSPPKTSPLERYSSAGLELEPAGTCSCLTGEDFDPALD